MRLKGFEPLHMLIYYHLKIKRIPNFATIANSRIEGFEPSNVDIKNQSLTIWLYPKNLELVSLELTTLRLSGTCSKPTELQFYKY